MSRSCVFCNNCGGGGHAFHHCRKPITSIGVIVYRLGASGEREYLLIRRKDSLGYVDFMRGKYPLHDQHYIQRIVDEMTLAEKENVLSNGFQDLWGGLWGDHVGIQYRGEERDSRAKFRSLESGVGSGSDAYTIGSIIKASPTSWDEPEWGFPKGRRNYQERDLTAALREFGEETGYSGHDLNIIINLSPLEECFTGSNFKSYKHCYFIGHMTECDPNANFQTSEVSAIGWFKLDDALALMRPYNVEKQEVLSRADRIIASYRIYS